jgi:outer membrane protein TolC
VDASAGYQYTSALSELQITLPAMAPGAAPISIDKELGTHDRTDLGLTATYAVFTGFSQSHSQAREERSLEAVQLDGRQTRSDLALQLGLLDIALRSRLVDLQLRRAQLAVRQAWLADWQAREKAGTATRAQVLNAKAEMLSARTDTVADRRQVDSLRTEFLALASVPWPGSETDTLIDRICPEAVPASPRESWGAGSLKAQAGALDEGREAAGSTRYPWITASAGVHAGDPGLNQTAGWMDWGVVGVQMQWNLFDGFERRNSTERLRSQGRSLRLEAARLDLAQRTRWETLRQERQDLSSERESLRAALDASTEAETAERGAVASGAALPDDLLEASLRVRDLRGRLAQLDLQDASLALRLRSLAGEPLSFEGTP